MFIKNSYIGPHEEKPKGIAEMLIVRYSTYAQVCVRPESRLELCLHLSTLLAWTVDACRSMLAIEKLSTTPLSSKIWCASTICFEEIRPRTVSH